jgi:hypothetical protein
VKNKPGFVILLASILLSLLVAACESTYTETMSRTTSSQNLKGGQLQTRIGKVNGTTERKIEVGLGSNLAVETDVTLSVEKGMFRIELIGRNEQVTLALEARDGQTVSGHGWMAVDGFGDIHYHLTAEEAENVEYRLEYTFP